MQLGTFCTPLSFHSVFESPPKSDQQHLNAIAITGYRETSKGVKRDVGMDDGLEALMSFRVKVG